MLDWLSKFYGTFQLLYMRLAINKMNGHGLSNTACHACQAKKMKLMLYSIRTSHRSRHISYLAVAIRWCASVIRLVGECIHSDTTISTIFIDFSSFQLTLAINKIDGHGLNNIACHGHLQRSLK